jgi:hypothetical protein
MKKIIILLLITFTVNIFAQKRHDHEKIEALKVAFITEQLDLTPKEAQVFWPIYNAHNKAMFALKKQERQIRKKIQKEAVNTLSEKEALTLIHKIETLRTEELALEKKLNQDLQERLSALKILKLKIAEHQFRKRLLRRIKQGRK